MEILHEDILEEYFSVTSSPKDTDVLGNLEVWVYNSDREDFPPHCHIKTSDDSIEFEVSILNWEPFRIKKPQTKTIDGWDEFDSSIKKRFFEWLGRPSTHIANNEITNKESLWTNWDQNNPTNRLENWIDKGIPNLDKDLIQLVNPTIDLRKLYKSIIGELTEIYFTEPNKRYEFHQLSPQDLLNVLNIKIDLSNNQDAIETVINAEKQVYIWSEK